MEYREEKHRFPKKDNKKNIKAEFGGLNKKSAFVGKQRPYQAIR